MLIDTMILEPNSAKRFVRYSMSGIIAVDPETGAQIRIGNGRRRAGRPRRYFVYLPTELLPGGHYEQRQAGTVTAYYDDDAIAAVNARMPKLAAKHAAAWPALDVVEA